MNMPINMVTADFNNDSAVDIVTNGHVDDSITIMFGHGNGSFRREINVTTGFFNVPMKIITADLNNDNTTDIVAFYRTNNAIGTFLYKNNRSFESLLPISLISSFQYSDLLVGDLDRDGNVDLVVLDIFMSSVLVYLGVGNGSFREPILNWNILDTPTYGVIGDFNGDTKLDMITTHSSGNMLSFLPGLGNGSFGLPTTIEIPIYATFIIVNNMNSDEFLDLITFSYSSRSISILYGEGNGSFLLKTSIQLSFTITINQLFFVDFDRNRYKDVVLTYTDANSIFVMLADADGFFPNSYNFSTGSQSTPLVVTVADIDNDSDFDIIVSTQYLFTWRFGVFFSSC